jgi:phosphatidylethanolamine-binding protein (PEBP) family uncharacterized protein
MNTNYLFLSPGETNEEKMKQRYLTVLFIALITMAIGCAKNQNKIEIPKDAAKMEVIFSWEGISACAHESPEIQISGIPEGTVELRAKLNNISEPAWNQGGGSVKNDGSGIIPAGALQTGFNGPCPPPKTRQNYEFAVMAVDAQGVIIGFGKSRQKFPPKR